MSDRFGPWASSIQVGSNPQLSAFWKKRMTMLETVSKTSPAISRRNLLWLGGVGIATAMLPTLRHGEAMAKDENAASQDQKSLSGRIFIHASLKTTPKEGGQNRIELEDHLGIIAIDPETGRWEKISDGHTVRVSHDGKKLVFVIFKLDSKTGKIESAELWLYDLASRQKTLVTEKEGNGVWSWSPDGKQLIRSTSHFSEDDKSHDVTSLVNLDGSEQKVLPIAETDEIDDWSPDGKWLVAVTNREAPFGRGYQLYRMRPDGTEELRLTKNGLNCYPRFSPDSSQILYLHDTAAAGGSLHIINVDGTNDREVIREENLQAIDGGCWSPDGRRLAIVRHNWKLENGKRTMPDRKDMKWYIEIMDTDGKNRRELPLVDAGEIFMLTLPSWR
jgi:Tol biopolymer transport system component